MVRFLTMFLMLFVVKIYGTSLQNLQEGWIDVKSASMTCSVISFDDLSSHHPNAQPFFHSMTPLPPSTKENIDDTNVQNENISPDDQASTVKTDPEPQSFKTTLFHIFISVFIKAPQSVFYYLNPINWINRLIK